MGAVFWLAIVDLRLICLAQSVIDRAGIEVWINQAEIVGRPVVGDVAYLAKVPDIDYGPATASAPAPHVMPRSV